MGLQDMLKETEKRREVDQGRYETQDDDLCMLCYAYGDDKRSLFMNCGYAIHEVVPEVIDLWLIEELKGHGYYLNICKSCRARLLTHLREWAEECRAMRSTPKDHDGEPLERDESAYIPVRVHGAIVWMTEEQYQEYRQKQE